MQTITHDSQPPEPSARPALADPLVFGFGGVAFEVLPSAGLRWQLDDEHRLVRSDRVPEAFASVSCVVESAPELDAHYARPIDWTWAGATARIRTGGVVAELRDLGGGRFVATAHVAPGKRGCSSLVTALATAIVYRRGGLVLHASGIEVEGGAVLFVGPSGAGKTTAANHCAGARWMARDRAAVVPTADGWLAMGLCGGDPVDLERSPARALPLRAIVRVRRGEDAHHLARSSAMRGLVTVRESLQAVPTDGDGEAELVDRALRLQSDVCVAELRSVLGADLIPALRSFLSEHGA